MVLILVVLALGMFGGGIIGDGGCANVVTASVFVAGIRTSVS